MLNKKSELKSVLSNLKELLNTHDGLHIIKSLKTDFMDRTCVDTTVEQTYYRLGQYDLVRQWFGLIEAPKRLEEVDLKTPKEFRTILNRLLDTKRGQKVRNCLEGYVKNTNCLDKNPAIMYYRLGCVELIKEILYESSHIVLSDSDVVSL